MTKDIAAKFSLGKIKKKDIEINFSGRDIRYKSSDTCETIRGSHSVL